MFWKINCVVFFILPFKEMEVINSNIFGAEGGLTNLKQCKQWKRIQIFAGAKSGGEVPGCCWAWRECAFPKGNLWPLCSNWVPNEPYVVKSSNVSKEARHSNILWKHPSFKCRQTIWDLKTKHKKPCAWQTKYFCGSHPALGLTVLPWLREMEKLTQRVKMLIKQHLWPQAGAYTL